MPASPAKGVACPAEELMRRDGWFASRPSRVLESFEERNTGASSSCHGRGLSGLQAIRPLLPPVCCNYCRSTFGHIDHRASSRG